MNLTATNSSAHCVRNKYTTQDVSRSQNSLLANHWILKTEETYRHIRSDIRPSVVSTTGTAPPILFRTTHRGATTVAVFFFVTTIAPLVQRPSRAASVCPFQRHISSFAVACTSCTAASIAVSREVSRLVKKSLAGPVCASIAVFIGGGEELLSNCGVWRTCSTGTRSLKLYSRYCQVPDTVDRDLRLNRTQPARWRSARAW